MVNGNQTVRPNRIVSWTTDPVVSPVAVDDAEAYVGAQDPILDGLLLAATDAVMAYTGVQIIQRAWTWRADRWPEEQPPYAGLSAMPSRGVPWIDLPAWPLVSVDSVTANDYEADIAGGRVFVGSPEAPLTIKYTAGYCKEPDTAEPCLVVLPAIFEQAILAFVAFMYDHRGACDVDSALRQSGARAMLAGHRRIRGGL